VETENLHGRKFSAAGLNTGLHAFLDASLLGWEYAMTHTQEIIDLLIEAYGVKKQTDHLSYEAEAIRKMIRPELVQIGHMNPGRWRHIAGVYQKLGILDADVSLEGFLYDPGSQNHFPWLNRTFFAAIFVIVLLAIGTGFLFVFNRKLRWEIHERKQAEEEIIRRELTLNKIFDVLPIGLWFADKNGRLLRGNAAGVAHDFNNMLGVILGHTEQAMLKMDENNDLLSDLNEIQKAANRSADITKQLLAFARKQVISPRLLDLNDTVESMLNMLRRLIGEDIDLVWQPAAHLWPVKMDPSQIDQILANLCVNARDAISGVGKLTMKKKQRPGEQKPFCWWKMNRLSSG
jgi:signal transduction histidine kinase